MPPRISGRKKRKNAAGAPGVHPPGVSRKKANPAGAPGVYPPGVRPKTKRGKLGVRKMQ